MKKAWPLALLPLALFALAANAQDKAPQVERWELMDAIGKSTKTIGDMLKGEVDYDAAAAEHALDTIAASATKFPTLFPEGSETGHDTRATPAIWENKADFDEQSEALATAATAAKPAATQGREALGPAFRNVGQTCRSCHTDYRAEKS